MSEQTSAVPISLYLPATMELVAASSLYGGERRVVRLTKVVDCRGEEQSLLRARKPRSIGCVGPTQFQREKEHEPGLCKKRECQTGLGLSWAMAIEPGPTGRASLVQVRRWPGRCLPNQCVSPSNIFLFLFLFFFCISILI